MNFDPHAYLDSHWNLELGGSAPLHKRERGAPTLERVSTLVQYLGSPQLEFPTIHLTGTNGKTSTARIIVQLCMALGLKVGSYTSPHLVRVNERIALNGDPISDEALAEVMYAVSLIEESIDVNPSYFEVCVAGALSFFADEAVDVAVIEVGLGGTWDATNVVDGEVAVITNVSLDHVEYLGPTRESIATEKAGIIKPGATLVLGETEPELRAIFEARASGPVLVRDESFGVRANALAIGGRVVDLFTPTTTYDDVFLALHGPHQADNAAVAVAAVEALVREPLAEDELSAAFATVQSPGRLEVISRKPLVILDGAHNVAGAIAARAALDEAFAHEARTLVVGLLQEKEPHEMLAALGVDDAALVVCCRPPSPRALESTIIAKAAAEIGVPLDRIEVVDTVGEAIGAALLQTPEDGQVVITGSLYVVGAARAILVPD